MRTDGVEYCGYDLFNITADEMRVFGRNPRYQFASDHAVPLVCLPDSCRLVGSLSGRRINLSFAVTWRIG